MQNIEKQTLLVVGDSQLIALFNKMHCQLSVPFNIHHMIIEDVSTNYDSIREEINAYAKTCDMVLPLFFTRRHEIYRIINQNALYNQQTWMLNYIDGNTINIGPIFLPPKTLCYECIYTQYRSNVNNYKFLFEDIVPVSSNHSIMPIHMSYISNIFSALYKHYMNVDMLTKPTMLAFNMFDNTIQTESLYRDVECNYCR